MTNNERLNDILDYLKRQNFATVRELSNSLGVSEMTVRRDLAKLEKERIIQLYHGGVSLNDNGNYSNISNYLICSEINKRKDCKERIARKAASLIDPYDSILVDTGSTTEYLANNLPEDTRHTVYCYALNIINGATKRQGYDVIACGGYYHSNTGMFESTEGQEILGKAFINKAFMSAQGVNDTVGVTVAEPYEIAMKHVAMKVAKTKILLADSTKFGKVSYSKYADLPEFDIIITDDELEPGIKAGIEKLGITLYLV